LGFGQHDKETTMNQAAVVKGFLIDIKKFEADPQGKRYSDVMLKHAAALNQVFEILAKPEVQQRMVDAELHFDLPALAGAVKTLEAQPAIQKALNSPERNRFKMAVGVAVKVVMQGQGFQTTCIKQAVGVGDEFNRAERYQRGK
jgi:hypothetical protein